MKRPITTALVAQLVFLWQSGGAGGGGGGGMRRDGGGLYNNVLPAGDAAYISLLVSSGGSACDLTIFPS